MKKQLFLWIPLLVFLCALPNYRGAQYAIEYDTWWEQAYDLQQSYLALEDPYFDPEPLEGIPYLTIKNP